MMEEKIANARTRTAPAGVPPLTLASRPLTRALSFFGGRGERGEEVRRDEPWVAMSAANRPELAMCASPHGVDLRRATRDAPIFSVRDLDTGRFVAACVRVAASRWARAVGLLGRRRLESGEGLWIAPARGVHTWGMRFPIDLVALDRDGVVVDCVAALRPWRIRLPRRAAAGVLELPAGALARSGTRPGHRLAFEHRPGSS
jgi:uncharacterized membrane protein (UPF0127 family)